MPFTIRKSKQVSTNANYALHMQPFLPHEGHDFNMLKNFIALFLFMSASTILHSQTFLNGSFENNSTGATDQVNIATNADFDAFMPFTTAFGTFPNLDILNSPTYGLAEDGLYYVALTGGLTDAFCMELSSPLVVGQSYTISFWARNWVGFTALPIEIGTSNSATSQGTVVYTSTAATSGVWTEYTFTFVATSADSYISVTCASSGTGSDVGFWVQVDNFAFVVNNCLQVLNLGTDQSICEGSTVTMDATMANADSYTWQDGSTNSSFTASTGGTYSVTVEIGTCTYTDQVIVNEVILPPLDLGADTTICEGATITLYGTTAGATNYLWQNGTTGSSLTTGLAGNYHVVASAGNCSVSDDINVAVESFVAIDLGPDIYTCEGETVILHAQHPGYSVVWQDGSTGSTFDASAGGFYSIDYSHGQCSASDNVQVSLNPHPDFNWVEDSLTVCFDHPDTLDATIISATYLWHDGTTYPTHAVPFSGTYSVTVTIGGCSTFDSIVMEIIPQDTVALMASAICLGLGESIQINDTHSHTNLIWSTGAVGNGISVDQPGEYSALLELTCQTINQSITINPCPEVDIFVPNTFTPDADGINDVFIPSVFATIPIDSYSFDIFDRYGQPIFQTDKTDAVWDGGYLGSRTYVPNGVYAWKMVLTYGPNTITKDGSILIIR